MAEGRPLPQTLAGLFADRALRWPERPFLSSFHEGRIETSRYGEAAGRIAATAGWLDREGFEKGDRIACYLDAGEPGVWFYLSCAATGVVPVPLGPSYSPEALAQLAGQAGAKAVFTQPADVAAARAAHLPVLAFSGDADRVIEVAPASDGAAQIAARAERLGGEDIYMFQPTSGSTGVPKLVMRKNLTFPRVGRLCASGRTPETLGDGLPEAGLLVQALTHGAGQYCLATALYLGAQLCIPTAIDTAVSLEEVERLAPTFLIAVPRVLRSLFRQHQARYGAGAERTPFAGPRLAAINLGGALPDEEIVAALERRGIAVIDSYGATEFSLVAMTEPGRWRPGVAGRIVDDAEVRIGEDGEVLVRSSAVMAGYFGDPELTRRAFDPEGYYLTGDLGEIEGGYLRIRGRKRDVFNSSEGSNIYPVRIEEAAERIPGVEQAMLVGDGKPFLIALLAYPGAGGGEELLDPALHAGAYRAVAGALAGLNLPLERFERVRRFALLGRRFAPAIYQVVGQAKVRRDRAQLQAAYGRLIDQLYGAAPDGRQLVADAI